MPYNRYFLDTDFHLHEEMAISGDEAHHLLHVTRKKKRETIEVINGRDQLAIAEIIRVEKKNVYIQLKEIIDKSPSSYQIILCQALPRLNRLDTILEKGTELGMHEIWLFPGQLGEKKMLSASQLNRLRLIAIAAMKQCGRFDLPTIKFKPPLLEWEKLNHSAYFGEISSKAPPFLARFKKEKKLMFFIGPEAGFSEEEVAHLRHLKAVGVSLHPNILRTDTAPLAALSIIHSALQVVPMEIQSSASS